MNKERLKVLQMVADGKITPEEAVKILEALEAGSAPNSPNRRNYSPPPPAMGKGSRTLLVRVTDIDTGKTRVNIRLPLGVVKTGVKMGMRFTPEVEGLDIEELLSFIDAGTTGQIVDAIDEKDGEHIEVFIE